MKMEDFCLALITLVGIHCAALAQTSSSDSKESVQPGGSEPTKPLTIAPDSSTARLRSAIEAATVPTWHGIAKVTETTMPVTGERLYQISNGKDSYCVKIPSPRIGIDQYEWERRNRHVMTCPR